MKSQWELRSDIFWSDGKPVSTKDLEFTVSRLNHKFFNLEIDNNDPKKFTLEFKKNHYDFFQFLSFSLLPAHKLEHYKNEQSIPHSDFNQDGYSYGPYKINKIDKDTINLVKNGNFVGSVKIDKINFTRFDPTSLKNPSYIDKSFSEISNLIMNPTKEVSIRPQSSFNLEFLGFNLKNPYLAETNIRRAIFLAIDRKLILRELYGKSGRVSLDLLTRSNFQISKNMEDRITLAHKLLEESNYFRYRKNKKRIELNLDYEASSLRRKEAKLIKQMLSVLDIRVNLKAHHPKKYRRLIQEINYSGMFLTSLNNLPDTNFYDLLSSNRIPRESNDYTGQNVFNWFNKDANSLLRSYQKTFNAEKRYKTLKKLNNIVLNSIPMTPLYYHPKLVILPKNILNFPFNIDHEVDYQISQDWIIKPKTRKF